MDYSKSVGVVSTGNLLQELLTFDPGVGAVVFGGGPVAEL